MDKKIFDFENKDYNLMEVVEQAKTDGEVAKWFTNRIKPADLVKIFVGAWNEAMDKMEAEGK